MDGNLDPVRPDVSIPKLRRGLSAPQALQLITRACVEQIRSNEPAFLQTRSPEALHQLRVALRRWRAALSVFRSVAPAESGQLGEDLGWLAGELNDARDLDVFADALEQAAARDPASAERAARLGEALGRLRTAAYGRAAEALTSERTRRLLWDGARTAEAAASALDVTAPSARKLARDALSRRRRQIRARGPDLRRLSADDRHQLRITAKKARYAVELLGDLFVRRGLQRRTARALKAMQDALGALNDIHMGEQVAARLAHDAGTVDAAFAAGLLAGARTACDEPGLLKAAARAYDRFVALTPFWRD